MLNHKFRKTGRLHKWKNNHIEHWIVNKEKYLIGFRWGKMFLFKGKNMQQWQQQKKCDFNHTDMNELFSIKDIIGNR